MNSWESSSAILWSSSSCCFSFKIIMHESSTRFIYVLHLTFCCSASSSRNSLCANTSPDLSSLLLSSCTYSDDQHKLGWYIAHNSMQSNLGDFFQVLLLNFPWFADQAGLRCTDSYTSTHAFTPIKLILDVPLSFSSKSWCGEARTFWISILLLASTGFLTLRLAQELTRLRQRGHHRFAVSMLLSKHSLHTSCWQGYTTGSLIIS